MPMSLLSGFASLAESANSTATSPSPTPYADALAIIGSSSDVVRPCSTSGVNRR